MSSLSVRVLVTARRKIWDSNALYVDGAHIAVETWEDLYLSFKGVLHETAQSLTGFYRAARDGAERFDNRLLLPVRDYVIMPLFWGAEKSVTFAMSREMSLVCSRVLFRLETRSGPLGRKVFGPSIRASCVLSNGLFRLLQYPIPSRQTVTSVTTSTMDAAKWSICAAAREAFFYVTLLDVHVTRVLAKARWTVVGHGPYGSLSEGQRKDVRDVIKDRYRSLGGEPLARYEFASHIRMRNAILYKDLVEEGGGTNGRREDDDKKRKKKKKSSDTDETGDDDKSDDDAQREEDEWLDANPAWQSAAAAAVLDGGSDLFDDDFFYENKCDTEGRRCVAKVVPLWFYLPRVNGEKPSKDAQWVRYDETDRAKLEADHLRRVSLQQQQQHPLPPADAAAADAAAAVPPPPLYGPARPPPFPPPDSTGAADRPSAWHEPSSRDVFVDEGRHVVAKLSNSNNNNKNKTNRERNGGGGEGSDPSWHCDGVEERVMRPVYWRFYGPGDSVRRAIWTVDGGKKGLQPYSARSALVLEDAYLFLKWHARKEALRREDKNSSNDDDDDDDDDSRTLLTVQVEGPDGFDQLVQFRSLNQIMAIKKTLGGALSFFKKRVYRGANVIIENKEFVGGRSVPQSSYDSGGSSSSNNNNNREASNAAESQNLFVCDEFSGVPAPPPAPEVPARSSAVLKELQLVKDLAAPTSFSVNYHKPLSTTTTKSALDGGAAAVGSSGRDEDDERDNVEHLIVVVHGIVSKPATTTT